MSSLTLSKCKNPTSTSEAHLKHINFSEIPGSKVIFMENYGVNFETHCYMLCYMLARCNQ